MLFPRSFRAAVAGVSVLTLVACAAPGGPGAPADQPRTVAARSASDQQVGDQTHPQIVAQFGGEVSDPKLRAYVREIGQRIVPHTEQPNAKWTFTVLDSPVVNAFALPGGYVYVTRGLIALANTEAQLASVIGHEIGHVTGEHGAVRQEQATIAQIGILAATIGATLLDSALGLGGALSRTTSEVAPTLGQGYVASYSRGQEFEADKLGVSYMAKAGYNPNAGAEFLASLQAETSLQARIAGGSYNPNRVDFFASHPATAERVQEAIRVAGVTGTPEGATEAKERFFNTIDGLVYGDSAEQGFVRGQTFSHPKIGFTFTVPSEFKIQNSASQVTAAGPNGAGIIFDGDKDPGGSVDAYLSRVWAPAIAKQTRTGQLSNLRRSTIDGLEAASAEMPAQTRSGVVLLRMTAIRKGDAIYRFLGIQPQGADRLGQSMDQAAQSFRSLSKAEANRLKPYTIDVHTVRSGDTVAKLAAQTPFESYREERFRVLNGLSDRDTLRAGDKVKIVRQ